MNIFFSFLPENRTFKSVLQVALATVALLLFGNKGFSQDEARTAPGKQWVYEFTVSGMRSQQDAAKLDTVMMRKLGIYSSKTDFDSKKAIVSVAPGITYAGLRSVMRQTDFIPDEQYILKEIPLAPEKNLNEIK